MKHLLSIVLIAALSFQLFGQNQLFVDGLKKNYKSIKTDGDFITAVDKQSKENCVFLTDGTLLYKNTYPIFATRGPVYGGSQHYIVKNASSNKELALVDKNGKTIISYPQKVTFVENGQNAVFMNVMNSGPQLDTYLNTDVISRDGTILFKSNVAERLRPVYEEDKLLFIGDYKSGDLNFSRLLDCNGKELIELGDKIYEHKLGGKYYFTSYRQMPGESNITKYSLLFDDSGSLLPGLRSGNNWYIELDGEVFFILQKYSKGFNGKIEKGAMFVYSPVYGELMSWTDKDKSLDLRNQSGKKMLVKTSESGAEEQVAIGNVALAHSNAAEAAPTITPQKSDIKPTGNSTRTDIDALIPQTNASHPNTFALVIANENYRREEAVPYALNDGQIFCEYLKQTLGVPEKNIQLYTDASLNDMKYGVNRLSQICDAFGSDASVIVYYAGHGIPDEKSRDAHLLPVDGYGSDPSTGYSLNMLCDVLSNLPTKQTLLLLDACFSGSQRSDKMMASNSRGVRIKPKAADVGGKLIVLSATQGDETAYPYEGHDHGMFTYFFLKKLNENKGKVSLGELSDYIISNVKRASVLDNEKIQTPTVKVSPELSSSWRTLNFGE